MHQEAFDFLEKTQKRFNIATTPTKSLDVGGQLINMPVHHLFPEAIWDVLDIENGIGVTIQADARTWRSEERYDFILCTEVFEHVEDWRGIIDTCLYHLNDGGTLLFTCASINRPPHGAHGDAVVPDGEWYENVAYKDIADHLSGLVRYSEVLYNEEHGDAYAYAEK